MLKNTVIKYKNVIIFTVGFCLIILAIFLVSYDYFLYVKESVTSNIELEIYNERLKNGEIPTESIEIDTDYIDDSASEDNKGQDDNTSSDSSQSTVNKKKYVAFIEIEKISLKSGLVSIDSYYNNVNRNIETLSISDYPNVDKGNLILASHSGSSSLSYFKNLYKLVVNDEVKIYYGDKIYFYRITKIYEEPKDGGVSIYRDVEKTTLTLITCTKNSHTTQTIYIAELYNTVINGGNND